MRSMPRRRIRLVLSPPRWPSLILAMVALAGQVALGALLPAQRTAQDGLATLAAASVLCQPDQTHHNGRTHHHAPAKAACPLNQAIAQAGILLDPPAFVLTVPLLPVLRTSFPPPVRAPPAIRIAAAFPRGPPPLICVRPFPAAPDQRRFPNRPIEKSFHAPLTAPGRDGRPADAAA